MLSWITKNKRKGFNINDETKLNLCPYVVICYGNLSSTKLDLVDTDKPGQFSALKEAIKQEGPLAKTPQQTILLNYKTLSRTSSLLAFVSAYAF